MTTTTVAQPINFDRSDVNAAINDALGKVTEDRWTRAIYRAAGNLAAGQFSYDGQRVSLRSASSTRVYHITTREPMACSCKAHERGLVCWHVVGARLLVRAAEHHAQQPVPRPSFAELTAAANAALFG
jgi:hypothetical protein